MLRTIVWIAITCSFIVAADPFYAHRLPAAYAQEDWKTEFDDICSKTVDATSLPKENIKSLIERCDKLKPRIERLDESAAKVYLKRLKMCKELFVFVLESTSR